LPSSEHLYHEPYALTRATMKWWIFLAWIAVAESSHISCSATALCVLERVQLQYTVAAVDVAVHESSKRASLVWAGIYESSRDNSSTLRARIDLYQPQLVSTHLQQVHSVIHSADNPGEAPAVLTAEWSISSDATRLVLRFNGPTNAPLLTDPVTINNAVTLQHGTVTVSAGDAEWLDSATLALSALDDLAWQAVMVAIEAQTLHVAARTKLLPGHFLNASADSSSSNSSSAAVSGSAALRLGTPGRYELRLFIDDTQIAVAAQVLTVQACDEETVLLLPQTSTTSSSSSGTLTAAAVQPFWSMPGVLALSGDKWLELPDKLISDNISSSSSSNSSSAVSADWSISFWLYVQEDASSSLPLALFSKGDG
jgi:hypothetical protein